MSNFFENYLSEKAQTEAAQLLNQQQSVQAEADSSAAISAEQQKVVVMNRARADSNGGHDPAELWGEEGSHLCKDFLKFAANASMGHARLLGSERLMGPDEFEIILRRGFKEVTEEVAPSKWLTKLGIVAKKPTEVRRITKIGWRSNAYALAYADPEIYEVSDEVGISGGGFLRSPLEYDPKPNVYLCEDGLIRHSCHPLFVNDGDGHIMHPQFGDWSYTTDYTSEEWQDGCYGSTYSSVVSRKKTRSFTEVAVIEGLQKTLIEHAERIQLAQLGK